MGRLNEIEIPKREVEVKRIELLGIEKVKVSDLQDLIIGRIGALQGDFRQKEIVSRWKETFSDHLSKELTIVKGKAEVTSGTYIRSISHYLGKNLGTGATILEIYRSQAGEFTAQESLRL
jgi:tRNA U55 pseudouridine synthase TruB